MTAGGTKLKDAIRQLTRLEFAVVWLTSYLLFTGQIILIILIAWGMVGRSLGLENLFWPESISDQFAVGLATSLLVGELWILRYALDERCAEMLGSNWWTLFPGADDQVRKLGTFLFLTWMPSLAAIVLPKLFLRGPPEMAWAMVAGMTVGVVGLTAACFLVERSGFRKQVQESRVYSFQPGVLLAHMPAERAPVYALALVELILAVLVTSILANYFLSPVPFLFLLLLLANTIYGFVALQLRGLQYIIGRTNTVFHTSTRITKPSALISLMCVGEERRRKKLRKTTSFGSEPTSTTQTITGHS
jgi:hypothetical protein